MRPRVTGCRRDDMLSCARCRMFPQCLKKRVKNSKIVFSLVVMIDI
jgi:hypothetical protein